MKRIERVLQTAMELLSQKASQHDSSGITASEVAEVLGILRCDSSSDLNKLCTEGKLQKSNTRPVRFFASSSPDTEPAPLESTPEPSDILEQLEQDNPSLGHAILLAKAAVSYPPHGLNILLTGETGVGKNFLAESIWKYACERQLFGENKKIPFITFSCAEYADNPQLLLSQLFGYKKGAFTGASENKSGLIEEADGGIFFLDEVHRLPPTGQEMLFSLIDKGTIRRLGDKTDRSIQVMLICATTEDLNTALLKTFLRRIPVSIHIPSLSQRTALEKLHFIRIFLQQAVKETGLSLYVTPQALQSLLQYRPEGNIGDLKNTLNLCCAKAYLNYYLDKNKTSSQNASLQITLLELPQKVYNQENSNVLDLHMLPPDYLKNGIIISASDTPAADKSSVSAETPDLYRFIERRSRNYHQLQIDHEELSRRISNDVETYFHNMDQRLKSNEADTPDWLSRIPKKYRDMAVFILSKAEEKFHCVYSSGLLWGFSLHLWQFSRRYANNEIIYNPNLETIKRRHYQEMHFLMDLEAEIKQLCGYSVPEDELGFWVMFLTQRKDENHTKSHVRLLLVTESGMVTESIAARINNEMQQKCVYALELLSNADLLSNYEMLKDWLLRDEQTEYLILTDNQAVSMWEERLYVDTGISCRIIPFMFYDLALDAAKEINANTDSVETLFQTVMDHFYQKVSSFYQLRCKDNFTPSEYLSAINRASQIIITLCSTGRGSASMLKEMLAASLADMEGLEIVAMSLQDDLAAFKTAAGDKLKLIISGVNAPVSGIPQIGIETVFTPTGIQQIRTFLENTDQKLPEFDSFDLQELQDLLIGCCSSLVPSLPPNIALKSCLDFCEQVHDHMLSSNTANNFYVGLAMHFLCMADRIKTDQAYDVPEWGESIIRRNHSLYQQLKTILRTVCQELSIDVPQGEICYILQLL